MSHEKIIPINFGTKNLLPDTISTTKSAISQEMCKMENEMDDFFRNLDKLDDKQKTKWMKELNSPLVESSENKKELKLRYNVRSYMPDEVKVKQHGNVLTVEAKHEESDDKRLVIREYKKSVALPEGLIQDDVLAEASKDGILTLSVPVKDDHALSQEAISPVSKETAETEG